VSALFTALAAGQCPELKGLHVNANKSAEKSMRAMVAMLRSRCCPKLQSLYINENRVGDDGMEMLEALLVGADADTNAGNGADAGASANADTSAAPGPLLCASLRRFNVRRTKLTGPGE
jgi:hypothetical protein